jgi:hypothetical protein
MHNFEAVSFLRIVAPALANVYVYCFHRLLQFISGNGDAFYQYDGLGFRVFFNFTSYFMSEKEPTGIPFFALSYAKAIQIFLSYCSTRKRSSPVAFIFSATQSQSSGSSEGDFIVLFRLLCKTLVYLSHVS